MGESTFGKYRLIAELGHGGMADVFLAVIAGPLGSGFSKLTVVKRLRQNLAEEPEFVAMLVDEARIAARLNHPNVVQTNEVGQVGNQYFLAMEYLDGQPLHRVQHRAQTSMAKKAGSPSAPPLSDPFPPDLQYLVFLDALAGLHHAHELADYDGTPLQIVHRDVTPHNIFITYEGQVKVVDFGIAKAVGRASETRQGVVKGKVRYMAPEQAIGQAVDRRADVFSIGVMLWEAAAGRRLWKDMDDLQILQCLVSGEIPSSPKATGASVPDEIDAICQKALAARPEARYQTAEEFRTALEQYLAESGKLVDGRRKLGPAVAELFKDKRQEIKSVIEKQLAVLTTKPSGEFSTVEITTDPSSQAMGTPSSTGTISVSVEGTASALMANAPTEVYHPGAPAGRTRRWGLAAILGVGAIAAMLAFFKLGAMKTAHVEAAPPPTSRTADTKLDDVTIKLTVSPPNAVLTLDGQRVGTPYEAKVPRDTKDHMVKIEAPGFDPRTENIQFANDLTMVFELVKSTPNSPPPIAAAPRRPPAPAWRPPPTPKPQVQPVAADPEPHPPPPPPPTARGGGDLPPAPAPKPKPDIDKGDPWNR